MLPSFFFFLLTRSVQKNIFMITWLSDFLHFIFENWVPQWVSSSIFIFRLDTPTWCTLGWKVLWSGINNLSVFLIDIAFSCVRLEVFFYFSGQKSKWIPKGVPLSYMIYRALFMPPFREGGAVFCKKCWSQLLYDCFMNILWKYENINAPS